MVKPDPDRDYYKDLGVANTADITEIKKQYKKLALKFHPDRNQANIEDATKQFQVIGEAHEVLSDPTSKKTYDVARAKKLQANRARYPTASGVKGNPWQDVGGQYPTPPRRADMPPRSRPASSQQHPTASQKYNSMFGGSGASRGGSSRADDESDDTYNAFDTFQRYRQSRKQQAAGARSSSKSTPQKSRPSPPETPPRAAPHPRTAAQKEKADAAFGNRRGKTGYQPASPAATDEPPVPRTNYFSSRRHTNLFENATANARREREESGDKSQSAESMDEDMEGLPGGYRRQYGDTLDPRSAGPDIGRARSTREPKRTVAEDSARSRPRSASVPNSEDENAQGSEPNGAEARPGSQVPHGASATASRTASSGPNNSSRTATTLDPSVASSATNGQTSARPGGEPSVYVNLSATFPAAQNPTATLHQGATSMGFSMNHIEATQNKLLEEIIEHRAKQYAKVGKSSAPPATANGNAPRLYRTALHKSAGVEHRFQGTNSSTRFSFNVRDDMFEPTRSPKNRFASNSAEDVTTAFGNRDDGFNFSANAGAGGGAPKHRASSATRVGRKSPLKKSRSGMGAESIGRMYGKREKADEAPASSPSTAKFDPREWTDKINPGIFNPPPTSAPSTSPTRGRSTTMRKGKKPTFSSEDLASHHQQAESGTSSPPVGETHRGGSPMAMDIDSPPSEKGPQASSTTARNINVEPSRPDWRSGDHNGQKLNGDVQPGSSAPGTPSRPPPAAAPRGSKANPITLGGSEDTDDLKASFKDLRKTEPLCQPKPTGLDEWADIKTNLPFESRASTNVHLDSLLSSIKTKKLDVNPPNPPSPPDIPLSATSPPANAPQQGLRENWHCYVASFASYMEEWSRFDRRVVSYLAEAQREMEEKQFTGRGYGWLDEDRDDGIIQAYQGLGTHMQEVRDLWAQAGQRHLNAMENLRLMRQRVRLIGKGSGLGSEGSRFVATDTTAIPGCKAECADSPPSTGWAAAGITTTWRLPKCPKYSGEDTGKRNTARSRTKNRCPVNTDARTLASVAASIAQLPTPEATNSAARTFTTDS